MKWDHTSPNCRGILHNIDGQLSQGAIIILPWYSIHTLTHNVQMLMHESDEKRAGCQVLEETTNRSTFDCFFFPHSLPVGITSPPWRQKPSFYSLVKIANR